MIAPTPTSPGAPVGPSIDPTGLEDGPDPAAARSGSRSAGRALWLAIGGLLVFVAVASGVTSLLNLVSRSTTEEVLDLGDLGDLRGVDTVRVVGVADLRVSAAPADDPGPGGGAGGDAAGISGQLRLVRDLWRPEHSARIEGATLILEGDCPLFGTTFCSVGYELTLPGHLVVEADVDGGSIEVAGTASSVDLRSKGGAVAVRDVAGPVVVSSSGGPIEVAGTASSVDLRSEGGAVAVRDVAGPVVVSSSGGPIEMIDSGGDVDASSSGGRIRIEGSTAERASVSSSGGRISAGFVESPIRLELRSSGGAVQVSVPEDDTAYDVDASSSGGRIDVVVRTDPTADRTIEVASSGGDVAVVYGGGAD